MPRDDRTPIDVAPTEPGAMAMEEGEPLGPQSFGFEVRYELRDLLGEGGMGEVRLVHDTRIGRDVAMKLVRPEVAGDEDVRGRFDREARVQGQLEHPSIVPVYDLGTTPDGSGFFTMKRVHGHTLAEIVDGLRDGDPTFTDRYSQRKLLGAFEQACLAVAFAHARGVIHRDLKPANLMLGDYGEVYVLDWGLARIAAAESTMRANSSGSLRVRAGATVAGAVMGTPGYMAPEQAMGALDKLDARTDVWALGAILFELLALEPLIRFEGSAELVLARTLEGPDARTSVRAPDRAVPPELETICVRATALDPKARYASARTMADDVQRYLDGDRDLSRRRELAAEHAAAAEQAAQAALRGGPDALEARARAIGEVSKVVALEPGHQGAMDILVRLLVTPPSHIPEEAEAELASNTLRERRDSTWLAGSMSYTGWFVIAPLVFWMGIRSIGWGAALTVMFAASVAVSWWIGRRNLSMSWSYVALAISTAAIALSSLHFAPFVIVPGMAGGNTLIWAMHAPRGRARNTMIAMGAVGVLLPFVAELLGWLPPSHAMRDGVITLLPRMSNFPPLATLVFLVIASLGIALLPAMVVGRVHDEALEAKRRLFIHMWHLRQLAPGIRSVER